MISKVVRSLAIVTGLTVMVVVVGAMLSGGTSLENGALSSKAGGRRAAFLLLESSGHRVLAWRQAPVALRGTDSLLIVAGEAYAEWSAEGDRAALDPRAASHYRTFLETGGRAVIDAHASTWLEEQVGVDLDPERYPLPRPGERILTPAGEGFEVEFDAPQGLPYSVDGSPAIPVLATEDGAPFAALYSVGPGSVLLTLDSSVWRNDHIRDADHAYLLLALVGLAGGERTVLIDDFVLGAYDPPGVMHLLFRGRAAPLGWTLVLCVVLALASALRAWRFPRDPRVESEVNPFLRVRSAARLLERARRPAQIAERLRAGILRRLQRRLRVGDQSDDVVLKVVLGYAVNESQRERWTEWLTGELPRTESALEALAASLHTIERTVESSLRHDTHAGAGLAPRWKHG